MKRGQFNLSFGMIFSIILIIVFLGFAFYVIPKFLGIQDNVKIGQFIDDFRSEVGKTWQGDMSSREVSFFLPKNIEAICFVDINSNPQGQDKDLMRDFKTVYNENENMFFYPVGSGKGNDALIIEHLNLPLIIAQNNPFCITNNKGTIKFTLTKGFKDTLVCIGDKCTTSENQVPITTNSNQQICKSAEDGELCNALDFTYQEGYELNCCNEFNLCC